MGDLTNPTSADHLAQEAGSFEPQRANNFSIEIPLPGSDKDVVVAALESFKLPRMTNDVVELHNQNEVRFVAGKAKAEDGELVIKDFVDKDALGALLRWRNKVYSSITGKIGLAKDYKLTCSVVLTAPDGTTQRVCKVRGTWPPSDPDYTPLNMTASEKTLLTLSLKCDKTDWSDSITGLV
jgi:hypothetical protein